MQTKIDYSERVRSICDQYQQYSSVTKQGVITACVQSGIPQDEAGNLVPRFWRGDTKKVHERTYNRRKAPQIPPGKELEWEAIAQEYWAFYEAGPHNPALKAFAGKKGISPYQLNKILAATKMSPRCVAERQLEANLKTTASTIKRNPGMSIPSLAKVMGESQSTVYQWVDWAIKRGFLNEWEVTKRCS